MRRVNRLLLATAVFLVAYVGVIAVRNPTGEGAELFPLFPWDLFSKVPPPVVVDYDIRMTELNGKPVDPPLWFSETAPFISSSRSPDAVAVIGRFGRAVDAEQFDRAVHEKRLIDGRFLNDLRSARYQLVRRKYDVLERVECHCFEELVVLGEFRR